MFKRRLDGEDPRPGGSQSGWLPVVFLPKACDHILRLEAESLIIIILIIT